MSDVLLSINIPTYNRADYLLKLLLSISSNIGYVDSDVIEINVIDNASEDETHAVMSNIPRHIRVNYIRNKTNLGPMRNIQMAHRMGRGKYVWVVGDDDYVIDGQLEKILTFLNESPDVMLLSYKRNTREGKTVGVVRSWTSSGLFTKNDAIFRFEYADKLIGFLSANIIRRHWVDSIDDDEYDQLDKMGELAHAAMIFKAIGSGGKVAYIADPTIVQTVDNGYLRYSYWKKVCFDYCNKLPYFLVQNGFEEEKFKIKIFYTIRLRKEIYRRLMSDKYRGGDYKAILSDMDIRKFLAFRYYILKVVSFIPNRLISYMYNLFFTKRT